MPLRDTLAVRCPSCGGCAVFHEPFAFVAAASPATDAASPRWGGWRVVEKFPSLMRWTPPRSVGQFLRHGGGAAAGGYRLLHRGVVRCDGCHRDRVHVLRWPDDACWQWRLRGHVLWAYDRAHALRLRDFVAATDRPPRGTRGELGSVPTVFLKARMRAGVVRAIEASLREG